MRAAVFISGRGSNLHALLNAQQQGGLKNVTFAVVVSDNPDAPGLDIAGQFGVPTAVVQPMPFKKDREGYDREVLKILKHYKVEFICLAGFMRLISRVLLDAYHNKIINIHPALLPSFPGLHAQKQALEYGVKVSGCTVHFVDPGVDTGPIILQAVVPVLDTDDEETLSARILTYEHQIYPHALELISQGKVKIEGRRVIIDNEHWKEGLRPGTLGPLNF